MKNFAILLLLLASCLGLISAQYAGNTGVNQGPSIGASGNRNPNSRIFGLFGGRGRGGLLSSLFGGGINQGFGGGYPIGYPVPVYPPGFGGFGGGGFGGYPGYGGGFYG